MESFLYFAQASIVRCPEEQDVPDMSKLFVKNWFELFCRTVRGIPSSSLTTSQTSKRFLSQLRLLRTLFFFQSLALMNADLEPLRRFSFAVWHIDTEITCFCCFSRLVDGSTGLERIVLEVLCNLLTEYHKRLIRLLPVAPSITTASYALLWRIASLRFNGPSWFHKASTFCHDVILQVVQPAILQAVQYLLASEFISATAPRSVNQDPCSLLALHSRSSHSNLAELYPKQSVSSSSEPLPLESAESDRCSSFSAGPGTIATYPGTSTRPKAVEVTAPSSPAANLDIFQATLLGKVLLFNRMK
jgi:hypothetical protein